MHSVTSKTIEMNKMKTVFITYDQAHQENVIEALNETNIRGYTFFEQAGGRGTQGGDPHLGTHAWPSMNSAIITIVDDDRVAPLLKRLQRLDEDNPMLGLRAFVWACEQSI